MARPKAIKFRLLPILDKKKLVGYCKLQPPRVDDSLLVMISSGLLQVPFRYGADGSAYLDITKISSRNANDFLESYGI